MQREKIKKFFYYLPVLICMGVIFWLSSRTSDESAKQSGEVLQWLINIFGDNLLTDFIVRKLAHCLEFTGLCVLFNLSFLLDKKTTMPILAIVLTSAYAATDEFHQLFVSGRACQFSDWLIDTAGAIFGSIAFMVIYQIVKMLLRKRKTNNFSIEIDIKNN